MEWFSISCNLWYNKFFTPGYHLGQFKQQVCIVELMILQDCMYPSIWCSYLLVALHDEIFLFVVQGEKRQPYDEDIRVPLIVRGPKVPSNMSTNALALNIDLVRKGSFRMLWILEYPVSSPFTKFDKQWTS